MDDSILWTPWRMPYLRGEEKKVYEGCVFCVKAKATDEAAAVEYIVARTTHVYATLNLYPYNNGHLLIVPYAHVSSVEDLPRDALHDLADTVAQALAALRAVYAPDAFNVGANIGTGAGAGIPDHFHVHIVPRWNADTNFMTVTSGTRIIPDTLESAYRQLRAAWPA